MVVPMAHPTTMPAIKVDPDRQVTTARYCVDVNGVNGPAPIGCCWAKFLLLQVLHDSGVFAAAVATRYEPAPGQGRE
jgi:hypothetical protein